MTLIWFGAWLASGAPGIRPWSGWLVAVLVCFAVDLIDAVKK